MQSAESSDILDACMHLYSRDYNTVYYTSIGYIILCHLWLTMVWSKSVTHTSYPSPNLSHGFMLQCRTRNAARQNLHDRIWKIYYRTDNIALRSINNVHNQCLVINWLIVGRGKSQKSEEDWEKHYWDPAVGFMSDGPLGVRTAPPCAAILREMTARYAPC